MRSIVTAMVIAVCLVGCARQMPVRNLNRPESIATVTGYSSEGKFVTLLNGENPVSALPLPNIADREYVAQVPNAIRTAVIAFIAQPETEFTIVAARAYGRFLLLDVQPKGWDDGNIHIVYDMKQEAVIGRFVWYVQG